MESADRPEELRALMVEYQAGSAAAFEQLYAILRPAIARYLGALSADAPRAADLTQEAFLQIHRARRSYDPRRPVLPWALAIARHVHLMDRRRSSRRIRPEPLDESATPDKTAPPDGVEQAIQEALIQVLPAHREAWVLHHVNGLSFKEIAGVLGLTVTAAKLRASRASSRLRALLQAVTE